MGDETTQAEPLWMIINFDAGAGIGLQQFKMQLPEQPATDVLLASGASGPDAKAAQLLAMPAARLRAEFSVIKSRGYFLMEDGAAAATVVDFSRIVSVDIATDTRYKLVEARAAAQQQEAVARQIEALRSRGAVVGPDGIIRPPRR